MKITPGNFRIWCIGLSITGAVLTIVFGGVAYVAIRYMDVAKMERSIWQMAAERREAAEAIREAYEQLLVDLGGWPSTPDQLERFERENAHLFFRPKYAHANYSLDIKSVLAFPHDEPLRVILHDPGFSAWRLQAELATSFSLGSPQYSRFVLLSNGEVITHAVLLDRIERSLVEAPCNYRYYIY